MTGGEGRGGREGGREGEEEEEREGGNHKVRRVHTQVGPLCI